MFLYILQNLNSWLAYYHIENLQGLNFLFSDEKYIYMIFMKGKKSMNNLRYLPRDSCLVPKADRWDIHRKKEDRGGGMKFGWAIEEMLC